jgi:hypothetical protein
MRSAGHWNTVRKHNKQELLDYLKKNKGVPITKALAIFSLQSGLKVSTLLTYVEELKQAELVDE